VLRLGISCGLNGLTDTLEAELLSAFWGLLGDEYRPSNPLNPLAAFLSTRLEIISAEGISRDQLGSSSWTNDGQHPIPSRILHGVLLVYIKAQVSLAIPCHSNRPQCQLSLLLRDLSRQRYPGKKSAKPDRSPIRRSTCSLRWRASRSALFLPW
jgi:hypothetical protein